MNIFALIYQRLQFQTDVYTFNFHHLSQINLIGSVWQGKIGSFFIIKCCEENWVQWGNFKNNNHFKADTVLRRVDNDSHCLTAGVGPSHRRQKSEWQSRRRKRKDIVWISAAGMTVGPRIQPRAHILIPHVHSVPEDQILQPSDCRDRKSVV